MTEKILALANPLLCAVFAAVFFALWRREPAAKWLVILSATYASRALGFFTFHFTPDPNGVASILAMHVFYSISAITIVWAICQRNGQAAPIRLYSLIALVGGLLMVAASYSQDYNARLYVANSCYGLIIALGCQVAWRKIEKDMLDKIILFLLAMGAFQFFIRPQVAIIVEGTMTAEEYRQTTFYAVMVLWLAISSLLMALALIVAALLDQVKSEREKSKIDSLTGLKMRGPFEEDAIAMLSKAKGLNIPVSAIVADIDHFKQVNDIWGHQSGDNAIAAFGNLLNNTIRPTDIAGRIGGEEFCLLIWNCPEEATCRLAERIRAGFEGRTIDGISDDVRLTASFGVSTWDGEEGYGKLFARADAALYAAKKGGRNRVERDTRGPAPVTPVRVVEGDDKGATAAA